MELVIFVLGAIALDLLALRFGADSRILDPRRSEPSLAGRWLTSAD
ncbi:MAG: hypothetical protein JO023_28045 [Chloroflexi bacterium]|nr:hypothetical protein [Chloroflexota bacterium]